MSYRWESEKIAQWRLKSRHGGLDENERLLYEDYLQSCALAEASVNASEAGFMERQMKKSTILRGVMSLALVALIGMCVMTGCKLRESFLLVPYTTYEINYKLTGGQPDTNKALSDIASMAKLLSRGGGSFDLGSFFQNMRDSGQVPDECFFDEVVSSLRGTSDMTEVQRHIWSDEAMQNFGVYEQQKEEQTDEQTEDPSYDSGPSLPYDGNGGKTTIKDLGNG